MMNLKKLQLNTSTIWFDVISWFPLGDDKSIEVAIFIQINISAGEDGTSKK